MKELSYRSLQSIRDVIPGENYANIKARLNQYLEKCDADLFAAISISTDQAFWYGDDHITYSCYSKANQAEKEEIAAYLESRKSSICLQLSSLMPFISKVFLIPSSDAIFWYRDTNGEIKVTLTQWGFQEKKIGQNVDIIDILIGEQRTLIQADVVVHFLYSDGLPACSVPFRRILFQEVQECTTDESGDYHLGPILLNKTFAVEDIEGNQHVDFTVEKDRKYEVVFNRYTSYTITVKNQWNEGKAKFAITVDGIVVETSAEGSYSCQQVILTPDKRVVVSLPTGENKQEYDLRLEPEDNNFDFLVKDEIVPDPPTPKTITITLQDYDKMPLPRMSFDLIPKSGDILHGVTDENGVCYFKADLFEHNKEYQISFKIMPEYRIQLNKNKNKKS